MIPVTNLTINELKKIKQKLCPHYHIQQIDNILDWECSDCNKSFFITDVINITNCRLKQIGNK